MDDQMINDAGYLTVDDAATRLGIGRAYFYRLANRYNWGYELLLGKRLYRRSDIDKHKPVPVGHPPADDKAVERAESDDTEYTDNLDYTD